MIKKIEWPDNNKTMYFEDLTKPAIKALKFAYTFRRKNNGKDIPWTGPGPGKAEAATVPPPDYMLSAENLKYSNDEQGRNALEEILGVIIRMGMEQGRRAYIESSEFKLIDNKAKWFDEDILRVESLRSQINNLEAEIEYLRTKINT